MAELPPELATRFRDPVPLGAGAFGRVVRATRIDDGRVVALKLLAPAIAADPELRLRFEREAAAGATVDSARVVRVLEAGVLGEPYLAMEYVAGHDLEEELRLGGGRLPPERADTVFADVLAGLRAVHDAGMLHRDLKPANVLLGEDGRARLTDFGLVRLLGEETLTRTGMILGTPLYMAPEQMMGGGPSPAWDLYAAAALYLQLWTRIEPFPGTTPGEILAAKQRGPSEPALAGLPPALAEFLRASLAPDPARRPADALALREAWYAARAAGWEATEDSGVGLESTVRLSEPVVESPGAPASPPPAPARRGRAGILLGGLAALVFSFGVALGPAPPLPETAPRGLPLEQSRLLRDLPARLRDLPSVDYVLQEFLGPSKPTDADRRWDAAVAALRKELAQEEVDRLLDALARSALRPEELDALGQVVLQWWLFSRTRVAGGGIHHYYLEQGERFEKALSRHTGARDEDAIDPWIRRSPQRTPGEARVAYRAENLAALRRVGGEWRILYGSRLDDVLDPRNRWTVYNPEGYSAFEHGRIRKTTLLGKRFPPAQEGGLGGEWTSFVRHTFQKDVEIAHHEAREREDRELLPLHLGAPPSGPLEFVVVGYSFDQTSPLVLTLVGSEARVRVPVQMPLRSGRPEDASVRDDPRTARRIRLPSHVLPGGLHTIEARIHGIQCMGMVMHGAVLENVFLRLDVAPE